MKTNSPVRTCQNMLPIVQKSLMQLFSYASYAFVDQGI